MVRLFLRNSVPCLLSLLSWIAVHCLSSGTLPAQESPGNVFSGVLKVEFEALQEAPYEQEMLLLAIRGYYPRNISLQTLEQPDFPGAGWMQLGRDKWFDTTYEGRLVSGFERMMAIFPHRSGQIGITPFVHRLTYMLGSGRREVREIRSLPLTIDIRAKPAVDGWWLPARSLSLTDSWDRPPDQLEAGGLTHRTVTLEVHGIGPELLPPAPEMRSPGIITFNDPEERSHELTPEGQVSRVTWHWTIRLKTSTPALLEEVRIPWFDSGAREFRKAVIPEQRIAFAGSVPEGTGGTSAFAAFERFALPAGLSVGLAAGLLFLLPGLRMRSQAEFAGLLQRIKPDPVERRMRRAARSGDACAVWNAARDLRARDREEGRIRQPAAEAEAALGHLERVLFGPPERRPDVDLAALAMDLLKVRRAR